MSRLLPDERVLWEGRPAWRAVARDVLHIRWLALYFAAMLIWGFASDRADGLGSIDTLLRGIPLCLIAAGLLATCAGFAWAIARSTRYTVTTQRCILRYGVALTATLSLPLRQLAAVAVASRGDGTGSIPLVPKPGANLRKLKLWPHVRSWQRGAAVPMLRAVPDAAAVAALISRAAAEVTPGVLHAAPARSRTDMPAVILSPAGD